MVCALRMESLCLHGLDRCMYIMVPFADCILVTSVLTHIIKKWLVLRLVLFNWVVCVGSVYFPFWSLSPELRRI